MDPKAIQLARGRLRIAGRAVEELRSALANPEVFADHWFVFLTAWKGVYTVLEQGAKAAPRSRQWFGGKKAQRKVDPLLQYLFEARNDEEHGLSVTVAHTDADRYLMRATSDVKGLRLRIHPVTRKFEAIDERGNRVADLIQHVPPGIELLPVTARGERVYHPPAEHLGRTIDVRPLFVAETALAYAEALVLEAETLPRSE